MKKNFLLVLITSIYMESWTEKHNISSLFYFIWNSKNSDEQEKMLQQVMQCWLRYLKGLDKFMMSERKFINVEVVWLIIQQILLKKIREILFYIQMRNEMSSFWKESFHQNFFLFLNIFMKVSEPWVCDDIKGASNCVSNYVLNSFLKTRNLKHPLEVYLEELTIRSIRILNNKRCS